MKFKFKSLLSIISNVFFEVRQYLCYKDIKVKIFVIHTADRSARTLYRALRASAPRISNTEPCAFECVYNAALARTLYGAFI